MLAFIAQQSKHSQSYIVISLLSCTDVWVGP